MSQHTDGYDHGTDTWARLGEMAAGVASRYGYDRERRDVLHDSLVLATVLQAATDVTLAPEYRDGFVNGIAVGRALREAS